MVKKVRTIELPLVEDIAPAVLFLTMKLWKRNSSLFKG